MGTAHVVRWALGRILRGFIVGLLIFLPIAYWVVFS